jgi:two-component system phosphate regulon sensor histidine kinase PhoR
VVAVYAAVALAWIAFSDRALEALIPDGAARDAAQTAKGAAFVVVTSALLYVLIRRGERGLRALGAEVRATVDSMADAVLLVDDAARIVEANRAALSLLGVRSKDEVLGPFDAWVERFAPRAPDGNTIPRERFAVLRVLEGAPSARLDAVLRRADGADVFVSVNAAAVDRGDGRRRLVVAVLRDVTPARRLDELRDEFLATAAHELKTPLAVVKAYAQLMARRGAGDPQALAVIQRQVDRLTRLVQHLLETTRLGLEGDARRAEPFDLGRLAAEAVDGVRPTAPAHDLRLAIAGPAPVVADRDRISRVLASLLDNAVRFSPTGGAVEVNVAARDGEATVSVRDHGVGIPAERQAQVFERYYRAHAGTPHDYGGLGLGLETSREIVRRHGGRMWFESEPGSGSTFHFTLPLAAAEAEAGVGAAP